VIVNEFYTGIGDLRRPTTPTMRSPSTAALRAASASIAP